MATCFIRNGQYFETVTDVAEWDDDRIEVPQRPTPNHSWDGSVWVDNGPDLDAQRAVASLDKTSFCKRLRQVGILPATEAVLAARGEWPATFAAFTSGMTEDDAADAQIEWAGALNIRYNHPLLQGLAMAYANGDPDGATAVLDLIFGIS